MQLWEDFICEQEKIFGKKTTDHWLRTFLVVSFDSRNLYLQAKDSFHANWFEEHIRPKLKYFKNNHHKLIKVHVFIENEKVEKKKLALKPIDFSPTPLDPTCTFSQFIVSKENILVFSLLQKEIDKSISYSPLFLYGPEGSGKTHILMATSHALQKQNLKGIFVSANAFTQHVVSAIRLGYMDAFRTHYRNIQYLIIDDIDIFANKIATQEEFFHTFNTLHTEGKLIILSAKVPPLKLTNIEERLISRFGWGVELFMKKLPKKSISELVEIKCKTYQLSLSSAVKTFIIECFSHDLHLLIKSLEALALRSHIAGKNTLDLPDIKQILSDLIQLAENKKTTPKDLILLVADFYNINYKDILSKNQSKSIAIPRQIAMFLLREHLLLPYNQIAKIFSKNHSTVMSSIQKIQKLIEEKNNPIHQIIYELKQKI